MSLPQPWGLMEGRAPVAPLPPGYAYYPTAADLSAFLEDAGFTNVSSFRLDAAILAGIDGVEAACQRHFLAGRGIDNSIQQPYRKVFDPPVTPSMGSYGAMLDLGPWGDMARIDRVQYTAPTTAETWVEGTDYRAMPPNALTQGQPVTWLETLRQWWSPTLASMWNKVAVTGLWGYSLRIPPSVWTAMLENAALFLFNAQFRGAGVPVGVKKWVGPDGISQEYDASMLTARLSGWQKDVQQVVSTYGRWGFG